MNTLSINYKVVRALASLRDLCLVMDTQDVEGEDITNINSYVSREIINGSFKGYTIEQKVAVRKWLDKYVGHTFKEGKDKYIFKAKWDKLDSLDVTYWKSLFEDFEDLAKDLKWLAKDKDMMEHDKVNILLYYAIKDFCRFTIVSLEDINGWEWVRDNAREWYEGACKEWNLNAYALLDTLVREWLAKEVHVSFNATYLSREEKARMCSIDYFSLRDMARRELTDWHDRTWKYQDED